MNTCKVGISQDILSIITGLTILDEERLEILKWLSEVPYERHHSFFNSIRNPETGKWLLEKKEFINWMKSTSSSILWLHGIGK